MTAPFVGRTALTTAAVVLAATVPLAIPTTAQASATMVQTHVEKSAASWLPENGTDLTAALSLLEAIPDSVLVNGDSATRHWMAENHPELLKGPRGSILACTAAIATLIATTAIPAAKILKIKKLITAGGGVAGALALEIIGVTAVKKGCF